MFRYKLSSSRVSKVFFEVYNELGTGYLGSVYEYAMYYLLTSACRLDVIGQ